MYKTQHVRFHSTDELILPFGMNAVLTHDVPKSHSHKVFARLTFELSTAIMRVLLPIARHIAIFQKCLPSDAVANTVYLKEDARNNIFGDRPKIYAKHDTSSSMTDEITKWLSQDYAALHS